MAEQPIKGDQGTITVTLSCLIVLTGETLLAHPDRLGR
jgi:hypothetical protein